LGRPDQHSRQDDLPRIDGFTILEEIGEGGFGIVYRARQKAVADRLVALKILKPGMDTREVLKRFEVESRVLAALDHPNIARFHGVGSTSEGRPYFAMELVDGSPITGFSQNLTLHQKLTLFLQACSAVEHAHQRGLIHRDLKPTNLLVSGNQTQPHLKVIDFGIAKALDPDLSSPVTLYTGNGSLLGTPDFMAPEQACGSALLVDTRTDVYGLGATLGTLLSGQPPLGTDVLSTLPLDELTRKVRRSERPPPSRWKKGPKELDWIVLKAVALESENRYRSVRELADDVQRFLSGDPIHAGPPSRAYRLGKTLRKYWRQVSVAILLFSAILTAGIISLFSAHQAREAKAETRAAFARSDIREAVRHQEEGKSAEAIAHLVRALRSEPENPLASRLLVGLLHEAPPVRQIGAPLDAEAPIVRLLVNRDGSRVFLRTEDSAQLWDTSNPEDPERLLFFNPAVRITQITLCEASGFGGIAMRDGNALLVSLNDGRLTPTITHEPGRSCDGIVLLDEIAVTAGQDRHLRAHNIEEGQLPGATRIEDYVYRMTAHPEGGHFAIATKGGIISLFKKDLALLGTYHSEGGEPVTLQFSHDAKSLFWADNGGNWMILDGFNARKLDSGSFQRPTQATVIAPQQDRIASLSSSSGRLNVFDMVNRHQIDPAPHHRGSTTSVAFHPQSSIVATGGTDASLRWWDAQTLSPMSGALPHRFELSQIAYNHNGNRLFSATRSGFVRQWETSHLRLSRYHLQPPGDVALLGFDYSKTSDLYAIMDDRGRVLRWDVTRPNRHPVPVPMPPGRLAVCSTPDLRFAALAHPSQHALEVWQTNPHKLTGGPFTLKKPASRISRMNLSSDARWLLVGFKDGDLTIIDVQNKDRLPISLSAHQSAIQAIVFTPDDKRALTRSSPPHASVRVIDLAGGILIGDPIQHQISHGTADLARLRLSNDGTTFAAGGTDQKVSVWCAENATPICKPLHHLNTGNSRDGILTAFGPSSNILVTAGGSDRSIRFWNLRTGTQTAAPVFLESPCFALESSSDGRHVAASFEDRTIRFYDVESGLLLGLPKRTRRIARGIRFAPDDRHFLAYGNDHYFELFTVPPKFDTPLPTWFLDFAEQSSGRRFGPTGQLEILTWRKSRDSPGLLKNKSGPLAEWALKLFP